MANEVTVASGDFRRTFPGLVDKLRSCTLGKVVVTRHGRPVAIFLSADEYERLTNGRK